MPPMTALFDDRVGELVRSLHAAPAAQMIDAFYRAVVPSPRKYRHRLPT
jgi:hypothetical protein